MEGGTYTRWKDRWVEMREIECTVSYQIFRVRGGAHDDNTTARGM